MQENRDKMQAETKKGQMKFDEFSLVLVGAIIFMGILAIAFTTPSEFPPKVAPVKVSIDAGQGEYQTFTLNVTGKITGVNVSASGEIAGWMSFSKTDLGAIRESTPVQVTINVPSGASAGAHTGVVTVQSKEGHADVQVTVNVAAFKKLSSRVIPVGDFSVSYLSDAQTLDSRNTTFVSRSYLYEKPMTMFGSLTDQQLSIVNGGEVRFNVDDTNDYGPIIVAQNGREIFREVVGPGLVVAPLNVSELKKSNTITIRADYPGLFFWAENLYSISNASVDVSYQGPISKTVNFTLQPEEYNRFDHVQVSFKVAGASAGLPPMRIALNGKTIFLGVPPSTTFNMQFSRDTFGGPLSLGPSNLLTFSFDQQASYDVSGATLAVFSRTG